MIYQVIKSDVFNISNRLKSIDKNYFIVYNPKRKKFEIHYKRPKSTYELTIPFTELDARTIDFVNKTRIENQQKIYDEIEKDNQKLENENTKRIIANANRRIYECR